MGHTLAEKILMRNTGAASYRPGDIAMTSPDLIAFLDIYAAFVYEKMTEMGFTKVRYPEKTAIIQDHLLPTCRNDDPRALRYAHRSAEEFGITRHYVGQGICHQLIPENRLARPGDVVYCTDSHTTTYGAVGAFATGVGYTEMAAVLGTGQMWVRVPSAIKIQIDGELPRGVVSKDIVLRILGDLRADGGTYKSLEFCGTAVDALSVDARLTIANMAVECGAKVGLFAPDAKTCAYSGVDPKDVAWLCFDDDAVYERVMHYRAEDFVPSLSCPQYVDNVHPVTEYVGTKIDQVFFGSCTNGRLEDLKAAAEIMAGKKVPARVKFIVTPATNHIYKEAIKAGYLQTLAAAGAMITHPYCSLCQGRSGGLVSDGEVILATNNRNFLGRMGSAKSLIYLSSPITAAVSALRGEITDPRSYQGTS
ncbi:MAG: 3-isopropylmalate dehydratase large subunit [Desulfovibrio sp.]